MFRLTGLQHARTIQARMAQRPFAARLIAARRASGIPSRPKFAREIGVSLNTVYRLERGEVSPSLETLRAWARVCGVTTDYLLGTDAAEAEQ